MPSFLVGAALIAIGFGLQQLPPYAGPVSPAYRLAGYAVQVLALGIVLVAADRTVLRNRRARPASPWLVTGVSATLGVARLAALMGLNAATGHSFAASVTVLDLLVIGLLTAAPVLPVTALILATREWYSAERERLIASDIALEIDRMRATGAIEQMRRMADDAARVREVNDRARQAQAQLDNWSEVIQGLQAQGYRSAEDVRLALQQQQLQAQENEIRSRYQELENQNLVDSTTANLQMEAELEAFRYRQAIAEARQYMVQNEKQKAFNKYPAAQQATQMVDALIGQGLQPEAAAQLVANQIETMSKNLRSDITKQVATNRSVPTPTSGGTTAPNVSAGNVAGGARSTLSQLLGINR